MVGNPRAERIVSSAILRGGSLALLGLVGSPACLLAGTARSRGRSPYGVAGDPAPARGFGELGQLVCRLVDRLEMALMLVLTSVRRDVRMPPLRHPAPRQLHRTLVEGCLELQQEHRLFDIEDPSHD